MATFPDDIPSFNVIGAGNFKDEAGYSHLAFHNDVNAEVIALASKLGKDSSADTDSHDYKLSAVTGTTKALSNYNPAPTGTVDGGSSNYYEYAGSSKHNGTPKYDADIWINVNKNVKVYNGTADATHPLRTIFLKAGALRPTTNSGCGTLVPYTFTGAGTTDIDVLPFGSASNSYSYIAFPAPKSWDGGTFTGIIHWVPAAGGSDQTVTWAAAARANGDTGTIAIALGTQGTVNDIYQGTTQYHASGEFTFVPSGTPAGGNQVQLEIGRIVSGDDNLAGSALLIGLELKFHASTYSDD